MIEPFKDIEDARTLAQAIVDTVREPLLVLDSDLRVLAVSRSYYLTFRVHRQDVLGRPLYALGDGQWHIPALRMVLEKIIRERAFGGDPPASSRRASTRYGGGGRAGAPPRI